MPDVPIRLRLPDGTLLGASFTQRIYERCRRRELNRGLPKLRRRYLRFLASDGSVHDIPEKHIGQAFNIDPGLTIIGNDALKRFDRQLMQHWRWLRETGSFRQFKF